MTLQDYNDIYKLPVRKSMTITSSGGVTITNTNIVSEKMSLEKSLCSEDNLRYGRCEAACFKITIADISHDFTGETLYVVQDIETDGDGYLVTEDNLYILTEDGKRILLSEQEQLEAQAVLGYFKVFSDKPTNDRRWRELTCYDAMYDILNADVATWYNGLTFPMTIKNLRDSFFTYLGITQETTALVNDSFVTQGGFSVVGTLSGKTVIEAICELNGCFGQITPSGTFDYVSLVDAQTLTLDYYVDGTGNYEDYVTDYITGINARGTASDVGTFVGTDTNVYVIENNPLIYGTEGTQALETALGNLLDHIDSDSFRPFTIQTYGNPMLPLGTKLTIVTRNMTIVSYVIKKEMTGIQALRDKYTAESEKSQPALVNNVTSDITRTKGKVHELEVDVNGLTSRVTATETNLSNNYSTTTLTQSLISQSESSIMTSVSQNYVSQTTYDAEIQNLQDQIDGRVNTYSGSAVPTLNNYPASDWTTAALKRQHVGDLYLVNDPGGTYDGRYFRFMYDSGTDTFSWSLVEDTDVTRALAEAELANQKADAAQAQLDLLQANVQNNYSTTAQMNSAINVAVEGIESTVSEAVSKYDESKLPTTPTAITIDYYGFGAPSATQYPPASCSGDYYLDNSSGTVYSCDGTAWSVVSGTWNPLPLITTGLSTSISQTKNAVVLKVNNNDRIVKVAIGTDPAQGQLFAVTADNISMSAAETIDFMAGGNLNLKSKNITITSDYFNINQNGGTIGGWTLGSTMLYREVVSSDDNATYRPMLNAPETPTTSNVAFGIRRTLGSDVSYPFRVNYDGSVSATKLTATGANISGTITTSAITVTGGTVGGWTINETQIRKEVTVTESGTSVTYRPMLNAPASPTASNIAFGIVKTVSGSNSYPFRINYDGSGVMGGWTFSDSKIYGGNSSTGVAVMKVPDSPYVSWTFASGGTSHSSYDSCPFRVSSKGGVYAKSVTYTINSGYSVAYDKCVRIWSDSTTGANLYIHDNNGDSVISGNGSTGAWFTKNLYASGTKSRVAETEDYGKRLMYCYETPSPMFGDVGEGKIAEDGKCYVWLDSTFSETIKAESYQVFLQKYGQGECYVTERTQRYFVVEGTAGISFGWEIKARQAGFENLRLESFTKDEIGLGTINYGEEAVKHLQEISYEREVA